MVQLAEHVMLCRLVTARNPNSAKHGHSPHRQSVSSCDTRLAELVGSGFWDPTIVNVLLSSVPNTITLMLGTLLNVKLITVGSHNLQVLLASLNR